MISKFGFDQEEASERGGCSRRDFLKGGAIVAGVAASGLALSGCSSAPKEEEKQTEQKRPDVFTDGTYLTTGISMHGPINVKTVIKDGSIESVVVLNHNETYIIGESAVAAMPNRIVESQCIDADCVTGATVTSSAISRAVEEAIFEAGGNPDDFKGYEPPALESKSVEMDVDVAVVGAGMAGLMAAWLTAESGKKVVVFEKMPYIGGCMPMTSTAWNAQGTKLQKEWGVDLLPNQSVRDTATWLQVYRDYVLDPESPYYNPEMPYISAMFEGVREATDRIYEIGVGFCPIGETSTPTLAPGQFSIGGKYCVEAIQNRLVNHLGVEILTEAPVSKLVQEDGAVVGLVANAADGTIYNVSAGAVILSSGGFVKNDEMMKEYNPDDLKFTIMGPPWATGDGLLMAKEVGAAWGTMDQGVTSHYTAAQSMAEISFIHYVCPGVIVNGNGDRFVNEGLEYKQSLRMFKDQESTDFYWIFDETSRQGMLPSGNSYRLDYTFLLETGDVIQANDYKELAEKAGLSGLVASLDAVNDCALNGATDEFGNENLTPIQTSGPMYAVKVIPSPYIAQGGVNIDPEGHVLKEDSSIIPGLYAAGDVTGSAENRDGSMYRVGMTQALGYGVLVGKTVSAEL